MLGLDLKKKRQGLSRAVQHPFHSVSDSKQIHRETLFPPLYAASTMLCSNS